MDTRDEHTMRAWAARSTAATLRACLAEADREFDLELARIIREALRERGLDAR